MVGEAANCKAYDALIDLPERTPDALLADKGDYALLWLARSGGRWRDLPERFGPYQTAKRRYYRWIEEGVFDRILDAVTDDPNIEWIAIDATVIRAQAQAAGARQKRWGHEAQALGRFVAASEPRPTP